MFPKKPLSQFITPFSFHTLHMILSHGPVQQQKNIEKISKLQKKCIRTITFADFLDHTTPLFSALKILKFDDTIKLQIMKLIYGFYKNQLPEEIAKLFHINKSVSSRTTRNSNLLFLPQVKSSKFGKSSLKFKGVVTWNKLIKESKIDYMDVSFNCFKKSLTTYFLNQYS